METITLNILGESFQNSDRHVYFSRGEQVIVYEFKIAGYALSVHKRIDDLYITINNYSDDSNEYYAEDIQHAEKIISELFLKKYERFQKELKTFKESFQNIDNIIVLKEII